MVGSGEAPAGGRMPVALVVNPQSGQLGGRLDAIEALVAALRASGFEPLSHRGQPFFDFDAMDAAVAAPAEAVLVYGGDGSVNAVAARLLFTGKPLGVLPGGTMNLLARDLSIPLELEDAIAALATGARRSIDVGEVNGNVFLCTSVLGMPARLARHRERDRGRWRPRLWIRLFMATLASLSRYPSLVVRVRVAGVERTLRTRALAVADNAFDGGYEYGVSRRRIDRGELVLYVARRLDLWRLMRLVVSLFGGGLEGHPDLRSIRATELEITGRSAALRVMNDGEVQLMEPPLAYRILPGALTVLAPPAPRESPDPSTSS